MITNYKIKQNKNSVFVVVVKGNINCDLIALKNIHRHNCKHTHITL